jgi:acetylornithine deacetylase/succinyl-diaminopimelate desuccinylase-like protein
MTTNQTSAGSLEAIGAWMDRFWDAEVVPALQKFIEIPNLSPLFDPEWQNNGHMDRAMEHVRGWVERQGIAGAKIEILRTEGRTPLLFMEVDGTSSDTILLYGHIDKQPEMVGWEEGLGPWTPVLRDGKLYGRGGADDGYAIFSVVSLIKALQEHGIPHSRLVVLIEATEESGSVDLPHYVDKLSPRIGTPALVVCLDSGCGNYDQLWLTSSLRGSLVGNLTVEILSEGVHSGDASGIVPSTFRVLRILLDRVEDAATGRILPEWMWIDIPPNRLEEARKTASILGGDVFEKFPWLPGAKPMADDHLELLLNRTWRPTLSYIGQAGMPDLLQGGNVLRPRTALKLSFRIPPGVDAAKAEQNLRTLFESDTPYGAKVTFEAEKGGSGWESPKMSEWLVRSVSEASKRFYGNELAYIGEGGSIPFMGMLGEKFPDAEFVVTGVLGPRSNAHGPNEFLHIPFAKKLSASMAQVVADFVNRK